MQSSRKTFYLSALIALSTLAVYVTALRNDFVLWDDDANVYNNLHIRSLDLNFLRWALTDMGMSLWQPVIWVSYALDYALWGLNPTGYHLTNVIIHTANTFLVAYLSIGLLASANGSSLLMIGSVTGSAGSGEGGPPRRSLNGQAALIAGAATGVLFGIHPLHVESATWVTGRTDLIYTLFFLLSTGAYLHHAAGEDGPRGLTLSWRPWLRGPFLLSLVFYTVSLASKPSAVVLPAVLVILDWNPLRRIRSWRDLGASLLEKIPFMVLSAATALVTLFVQRTLGTMAPLEQAPFGDRLLVAGQALAGYLGKMAVPLHLIPYYPYPENPSLLSFGFLASAVLVCGITAACLYLAKRRPAALAAWSYYVVTLIPVLGLVKVRGVAMADRYTYLPSLGPFLLLGLAAAWIWTKADSLAERRVLVKRVIAAGAVLIVLALSALTVRQIAVWRNSIDFWTYVIEKGPYRIPLAFNNRGLAFLAMGQRDRAIKDCTEAIALDPAYHLAYYNRGKAYLSKGQVEEALKDYSKAIELQPQYADTYTARGQALAATGRFEQAIEDFATAITLDPDQYEAYAGRGAAYKELGRYGPALADFNAAIALSPGYVPAYIYRGIAFKDLGRFDDAIGDYTKAISLNPSGAEAYNNRGVVYKYLGELDTAFADYTRAIELDPSFALAYCNRGIVLGMMDHADKAINDFSQAISLKPDLVKAYLERGRLYRSKGEKTLAKGDLQRACDLGSPEGCAAARIR